MKFQCSVHNTPKELNTQQSPIILDLCLKTTRSGKSRDCREAIDRFRKQKRKQNVGVKRDGLLSPATHQISLVPFNQSHA